MIDFNIVMKIFCFTITISYCCMKIAHVYGLMKGLLLSPSRTTAPSVKKE